MNKKQKNALAVVATDNTFEKFEYPGGYIWVGKCIFCNKKLSIGANGNSIDLNATIEHIVPKSRGGTDDVENLAIACKGCNAEKGIRHDNKKRKSRALEIVIKLQAKRAKRWRDPVEDI